ncbi:hypothetical protein V8C35DRAFT_18173 [Trichoderma chlorosporum]
MKFSQLSNIVIGHVSSSFTAAYTLPRFMGTAENGIYLVSLGYLTLYAYLSPLQVPPILTFSLNRHSLRHLSRLQWSVLRPYRVMGSTATISCCSAASDRFQGCARKAQWPARRILGVPSGAFLVAIRQSPADDGIGSILSPLEFTSSHFETRRISPLPSRRICARFANYPPVKIPNLQSTESWDFPRQQVQAAAYRLSSLRFFRPSRSR